MNKFLAWFMVYLQKHPGSRKEKHNVARAAWLAAKREYTSGYVADLNDTIRLEEENALLKRHLNYAINYHEALQQCTNGGRIMGSVLEVCSDYLKSDAYKKVKELVDA